VYYSVVGLKIYTIHCSVISVETVLFSPAFSRPFLVRHFHVLHFHVLHFHSTLICPQSITNTIFYQLLFFDS